MLRKLKTLTSVYYDLMIEYRAEIVLWMLSGVLPFILMAVWMKASEGYDYGFSSLDFARYFFAVFLTHQLISVWVIWEFEEDVLYGHLSHYLLQPLDPVWRYVSTHLAERFSRLPFLFLIALFFFLLYPKALWSPTLPQLGVYLAMLLLAFAVRFLIQYSLSMLSFWMERVSALEEVHFLLFMFLSGYIAPLDLFPEGVRDVVMLTPFPYMINAPVNVLLGREVDYVQAFSVMGVWFAVLFILNRLLWRMGVRKYSAMGA